MYLRSKHLTKTYIHNHPYGTTDGRRYMGRWFRPAVDYSDDLYRRCRCCSCAARMQGISWCKWCADARIAKRQAEPVEVARRAAIVRRLGEIDAALAGGAYDAATLRRWFAWIDRARRYEVECTLPVTMRLGAAMGATLPAVPIRVDSILPFRSRRVYESRVAEYLAARGNHRPVVVVGWPTHGERQLVDGRHRMSAALVLGLKTIPAAFAMFADARRWGDAGCW